MLIRQLVAIGTILISATAPAAAQSRQGKPSVATAAQAAAVNKIRPGLGDDPGQPVMLPLQLSPGVQIDGPIMGADADEDCDGKRLTFGTGQAVKVCVAFCGSGKVSLPPGMMILSDNPEGRDEGQHGLLVEDVHFTVPPTLCTGGMKKDETEEEKRRKRFIVELGTYCLNESKLPSFRGMKYTLGGVTADSDMQELVRILSRKKISTETNPNNPTNDHRHIVQEAIYSITDRKGLTAQDRRKFGSLPNRS